MAQAVKFSYGTLGKTAAQRLTNNPGMRITELLYKTTGTILPSAQACHPHTSVDGSSTKERTEPTTWQAFLVVMEVGKKNNGICNCHRVLNLRLFTRYCIRYIKGRCHLLKLKDVGTSTYRMCTTDISLLTSVHTTVCCVTALCRFD